MPASDRLTDEERDRFAAANNLKDVTWIEPTLHGILVGFTNGTSKIVGDPVPPCRTWPLKARYR